MAKLPRFDDTTVPVQPQSMPLTPTGMVGLQGMQTVDLKEAFQLLQAYSEDTRNAQVQSSLANAKEEMFVKMEGIVQSGGTTVLQDSIAAFDEIDVKYINGFDGDKKAIAAYQSGVAGIRSQLMTSGFNIAQSLFKVSNEQQVGDTIRGLETDISINATTLQTPSGRMDVASRYNSAFFREDGSIRGGLEDSMAGGKDGSKSSYADGVHRLVLFSQYQEWFNPNKVDAYHLDLLSGQLKISIPVWEDGKWNGKIEQLPLNKLSGSLRASLEESVVKQFDQFMTLREKHRKRELAKRELHADAMSNEIITHMIRNEVGFETLPTELSDAYAALPLKQKTAVDKFMSNRAGLEEKGVVQSVLTRDSNDLFFAMKADLAALGTQDKIAALTHIATHEFSIDGHAVTIARLPSSLRKTFVTYAEGQLRELNTATGKHLSEMETRAGKALKVDTVTTPLMTDAGKNNLKINAQQIRATYFDTVEGIRSQLQSKTIDFTEAKQRMEEAGTLAGNAMTTLRVDSIRNYGRVDETVRQTLPAIVDHINRKLFPEEVFLYNPTNNTFTYKDTDGVVHPGIPLVGVTKDHRLAISRESVNELRQFYDSHVNRFQSPIGERGVADRLMFLLYQLSQSVTTYDLSTARNPVTGHSEELLGVDENPIE